MRLSRRVKPFDSDQFIYELKIDGFRALPHIAARYQTSRNEFELIAKRPMFRVMSDRVQTEEWKCMSSRSHLRVRSIKSHETVVTTRCGRLKEIGFSI